MLPLSKPKWVWLSRQRARYMTKRLVVTCRRYFDLSDKKCLSVSADVSVCLRLSVALSLELSVHKNAPACMKWVLVLMRVCVRARLSVCSRGPWWCVPFLTLKSECRVVSRRAKANANAKRMALESAALLSTVRSL